MKVKLFSVASGNRKTKFETLEANVNEWLMDNPNIVVVSTDTLSQPNLSWSHLSLAVWYTDQ